MQRIAAASIEQARIDEERRRSPDQQRVREASRTEYEGLRADAALGLLRSRFDEFAQVPRSPLDLPPDSHVKRFVSRVAAVVDVPGAVDAFVQSSVPVAAPGGDGRQQAIDVALEPDAADFTPSHDDSELVVPGVASEAISLGRAGVGFRLVGAANADGQLDAGRTFYAGVATDTDLVVQAVPGGMETFSVLRSARSPERQEFAVSMPQGARLESSAAGGATVMQGEDVLLEVRAPTARDADGQPVKVTMTVEQDRLVLTVPHRSADVHYPVLVDPTAYSPTGWTPNTTTQDFAGWTTANASWNTALPSRSPYPITSTPAQAIGNTAPRVVTAPAGKAYYRDDYGAWEFHAPGKTFVYRLAVWTARHTQNGGSCLYEGIWKPNGTSPWIADSATSLVSFCRPMSDFSWDICVTPLDKTDPNNWVCRPGATAAQGGYPGNEAAIDLSFPADAATLAAAASAQFQGAGVWLSDREVPRQTVTNSVPADTPAWSSGGINTTTVTPTSDGLGIQRVDITRADASSGNRVWASCGDVARNPCPASWNAVSRVTTFSSDLAAMPNGVGTYTVRSTDLLDRQVTTAFKFKVDHEAPAVTLSGSLWDNRRTSGGSQTLDQDHYQMTVSATEGTPGAIADTDKRAGMRSISADQLKTTQTGTVAACENGSLADTAFEPADTRNAPNQVDNGGQIESFDVPTDALPEGTRLIRVVSTDRAGNKARKCFEVFVARPPALELSGGLRGPLATGRDLHIKLTDAGSGPDTLGVWLDPGATVDNPPAGDARFYSDPCAGGCPTPIQGDWTLPADTPTGTHEVLVKGTDAAGNAVRERWTITVVDSRMTDRSKLGLEQWFDLDATSAGGDSTIYVNGETGNAVWHSVPISNLGRGLSTVVNLTYNSQDRGGMLGAALGSGPIADIAGSAGDALLKADSAGLAYAEAGAGFSIGVSGPTRLNEPLSGVREVAKAEALHPTDPSAADGLPISLTDADGTVHRFTHSGGRWVAPPGLDMYLRRYSAADPSVAPVLDEWAMTRPDGVTHFFDENGFLRSTRDRNGNTLTYHYDSYDAFGGGSCVAGDALGLVSADGRRLCAQRVDTVTDPGGQVLTIHYVSRDLSDSQRDAAKKLPTTADPDYAGLLVGAPGRISDIVDHAGRTLRFDYDDGGRLVKLTEAQGTPEQRITKLGYDPGAIGEDRPLTDVVELRDLDGNGTIADTEEYARTTVAYDPRGNLPTGQLRPARKATQVVKRSGAPKDYAYLTGPTRLEVKERLFAAAGNPRRDATTTHELDGTGRPLRVTDPVNVTTELAWSTDNKVTSQLSAKGTPDEAKTEFAYDTSHGTGMLESQTEYPQWPSQTGARVTDPGWRYGDGGWSGLGDAGGGFVADMTSLQRPKASTGWTYTVDAKGNMTRQTDAKGNYREAVYDTFGRVTDEYSEFNPLGLRSHVQYSDFHDTGQPRLVTDARSKQWTYRYDPVGNVTSVIDPRATDRSGATGNPYTTTLGYDAFDRLTSEKVPKLSSAGSFVQRSRTYDRNGNLLTTTDGVGQQTRISYSKSDLPTSVSAPASDGGRAVTTYVYDDGDRLIGRVDPRGDGAASGPALASSHRSQCEDGAAASTLAFASRYCLDDAGQVLAEVRYSTGQPQIRTFAYDARGNKRGEIDPNRNSPRTITAAITAATTAANQRIAYGYDKADELVSTTETPTEAGKPTTVWRYGYDDNGNRTTIEHPQGASVKTTMAYDHRDQLISTTDPLGQMTCSQRRKDERVIAVTTPRGTAAAPANCAAGTPYTYYTTSYTYDDNGDVASRSVPFAPNQYGKSDAQLAAWKLTYTRDEVGNPTTISDARGNAFQNTFYDTGDLRSTERPSFYGLQWPSAGTAPNAGDRDAQGDAVDHQAGDGGPQLVERQGRSANAAASGSSPRPKPTLGQTDFGRVDPQALPDLLPPAGATSFDYDDEMRLTAANLADGTKREVTYDPAGRVSRKLWPYSQACDRSQQTQPTGCIEHSFSYDADGNLTKYTDGRRNATDRSYDGFDRLLTSDAPGSQSSETGSLTREITRFSYDYNDNALTRESPRGSSTSTAGDYTFHYGWDSLDQLTSESDPASSTWTYDYDAAGNRTLETTPRGAGLSGSALRQFQNRLTYDTADQLTDIGQTVNLRPDATATPVATDLNTHLDYDADGNTTKVTAPGAKDAPTATGAAASVQETTYDGRGLPWQLSIGSGAAKRTTVQEYGANGNLRRIVKPAGLTAGVPTVADDGSHSDAELAQNSTLLTYNADDLLTTRYLPWNSDDSRKFRQDFQRNHPLGRVTSILSPYEADDGSVPRTSYTYWQNDWTKSVSDEKLTDPSSHARITDQLVSYDYDETGNQTAWTSKNKDSANGRTITRAFWPDGTLKTRTARKVDDPDAPASRRSYNYFYNPNQSLVEMVDERHTSDSSLWRRTKIARDDAERQLAVDERWQSKDRDTLFAYDTAGNQTERRTDGAFDTSGTYTAAHYAGGDAKAATFTYDSLDRETDMNVVQFGEPARTWTTVRSPSGARSELVKPNGTREFSYFDDAGRPVRSLRQRGSQTGSDPGPCGDAQPDGGFAHDACYGYDADGNRESDERGSLDYNARDQLTRWTRPGNGRTTEYTLNGDGSTTHKVVRATGDPASAVISDTTYTYRGERLLTAQTADVRADYRYDDFGNVTRITQQAKDGSGSFPAYTDSDVQSAPCSDVPTDVASNETYYCFDEFERMALSKGLGIDSPQAISYDGLDRRDDRTFSSGGTQTTRDYSYVGTSELLSREGNDQGGARFFDYDSSGDRHGFTSKTTSTTAPKFRSYTKDANGSVLGIEEDDGTIPSGQSYDYDPYGQLDQSEISLNSVAQDNPFRFEGFYYDSGVQSYDMLARQYQPDVGRFLTQDRYASAGDDLLLQADPLTQNRYAFAGANPVTNVEFDGHEPISSFSGSGQQTMYSKRGRCYRDCPDDAPARSGEAKTTTTTSSATARQGPDSYYQRGDTTRVHLEPVKPISPTGIDLAPGANPAAHEMCPTHEQCQQGFATALASIFGAGADEALAAAAARIAAPIVARGASVLSRSGRQASKRARFVVDSAGGARVFVRAGDEALEVSSHAARRITQRGLTVDRVEGVVNSATPFRYYHGGTWKTGYYDSASGVFVGRGGNTIMTVINNAKPKYIENLKAAQP